jgi:hypothetical protein
MSGLLTTLHERRDVECRDDPMFIVWKNALEFGRTN